MSRRIITIILMGIPPLLLMRWDGHHGHHVPKWLMWTVCAPLVIALVVAEFSSEDEVGDTGRAIGNWLLFLMGLAAMGFGIVGFALRHESAVFLAFAWMFPVGALMTVAAAVRTLRD